MWKLKYTPEPHTTAPQQNGCKEGEVKNMTHEKESSSSRNNTGGKVLSTAFLKLCCFFSLWSLIGGEQQLHKQIQF